MVTGRYNDGLSARGVTAEVWVEDRGLSIQAGDQRVYWPGGGLSADSHAGETRLSHASMRNARLTITSADWAALQSAGVSAARAGAGGGRGLVIGLAVAGLSVAAFVFIGVPALSGPLARATPPRYERDMGRNLDLQINFVMPECEDPNAQLVLEDLGDRLAERADTPFDVQVRAVHSPVVNAFALPGGPVLLTSALIEEAENPDEVSAVIAHEIAHIERRHVMQAVWRSLGIGMLLDAVVGGGSGAGQQAVIVAGQVTDLSYSRAAEAEADARGMELLHALGLSSQGMARFYRRMAGKEGGGDVDKAGEFLSTHPDTRRRLRAAEQAERAGAPALSAADWTLVRAACAGGPMEGRPWSRLPLGRDDSPPGQVDQVRQH